MAKKFESDDFEILESVPLGKISGARPKSRAAAPAAVSDDFEVIESASLEDFRDEQEFGKKYSWEDIARGAARDAATGYSWGAAPFAEAAARSAAGEGDFKKSLSDVSQEMDEFRENYPVTSWASDIGGSILSGGVVKKLIARLAGEGLEKEAIKRIVRELGKGEARKEIGKQAIKQKAVTSGLAGVEGGLRTEADGGDFAEGALIASGLNLVGGEVLERGGRALKPVFKKGGEAIEAAAERIGLSRKKLQETSDRMAVESFGLDPDLPANFSSKKEVSGLAKTIREEELLSINPLKGQKDRATRITKVGEEGTEGLIPEYSRAADDFIDQTAQSFKDITGKDHLIDLTATRNGLINEFRANLKRSASAPDDIKALEKELKRIMGKGRNGKVTLQELQVIKKDLNSMLSSKPFFESDALGRQFKEKISIELKNKIEDGMDKIGLELFGERFGEQLAKENARIGDLYTLQRQLTGPKGKTGLVKQEASLSLLSPKDLGKRAFDYKTRLVSSALNTMANIKVPRTTKGVFENKELVLAKLFAAGAPSVAARFNQVVDSDPARLSALMPTLIEALPDIFATSAYASEFDGRLFNEQDKKNYTEQVVRARTISNTEKAKILNNLNLNGSIVDLSGGGDVPEETLMKKAMEKKQQVLELPPMDNYAE